MSFSFRLFKQFVPLLLALLFATLSPVLANNSIVNVTKEDVVRVLGFLYDFFPPYSSPPPSNITGLTHDECFRHEDCVPPRACDSCESPPCTCVTSPSLNDNACQSSTDCHSGEFCSWYPKFGVTAGQCFSSRTYKGNRFPILHTPMPSMSPHIGLGLTGDRCFMQSHCRGARSCLGHAAFPQDIHNISTCYSSIFPCVCTPLNFELCSPTSDCADKGETCAILLFDLYRTYSFLRQEHVQAQLASICLTQALNRSEHVLLINSTSPSDVSTKTLATLLDPTPVSRTESGFLKRSAIQPFSARPLSRFNSLTTNDLANDFISGITTLIILIQISSLIRGFMYSSSSICQSGYNRYIAFSRFYAFRNLARLIRVEEPIPNPREQASQGMALRSRYQRAILPLLALVVLYVAEIGAIISGTQVRDEITSATNFDPVVALADGTNRRHQKRKFDDNCDDFFIPVRGMQETGRVLKCVQKVSDWEAPPFASGISMVAMHSEGRVSFQVCSQNRSCLYADIRTLLRGVGGRSAQTMPLRADLSEQTTTTLLDGILNRMRSRLGYPPLGRNLTLWTGSRSLGSQNQTQFMEFGHRHDFTESADAVLDALMAELRALDLVLNSSGPPWVFQGPYKFEPVVMTMAVVKRFRVSQGALLIVALVVTIFHIAVNSFLTHFEDVAYIAMKDLIGDDCLLGPLAGCRRVEPTTVQLEDLYTMQEGQVP